MTQNTLQKASGHTVCIDEQKNIKMTGVLDVGNFSETIVDIKTTNGTIILKGKNFNISKLDIQSGELCISGEVGLLQYTKTKQKRSGFEALFK